VAWYGLCTGEPVRPHGKVGEKIEPFHRKEEHMKLALVSLFATFSVCALADESIRGDVRSDGTYIESHMHPSAKPVFTEQVIYKGVVGNLLEAVPLEPDDRVQLQRTSAVVSNTMSGRSLALLLGIANPVLMIVGLVWGAWSASQIRSNAAVQVTRNGKLCMDDPAVEGLAASVIPVAGGPATGTP
jgi:hypothetical protein